MGDDRYSVGLYLDIFDEELETEADLILWNKVKKDFENMYFPIEAKLVTCCVQKYWYELTNEPMSGYIKLLNKDIYLDGDFWDAAIRYLIEPNVDFTNIEHGTKESLGIIKIKQAYKNFYYKGVFVPKGALFGMIGSDHMFILKNYKQFNHYKKYYKLDIISIMYDYEWQCDLLRKSYLLQTIIDYIDEHNLYDTEVENNGIIQSYKEDTQRGCAKSYKSVKEYYYKSKWFFRT